MNFLPQFKPLFEKFRYKVCFSGRASAKSTHIAIALLWYASRTNMKILCLREHLNSIQESSKAQLEQIIEQTGTSHAWTITKTEIVHNVTGSRFLFKGLATNYNSIKSIPDIDIAFIEECETISKESLDILIPTIRKENSQIWFAGNPRDRMEAVAQMFIENAPPPSTVIISNDYRDNPYLSQTIIDEANHMKESNPELYRHIWLGEYLDVSNLIMVKNVVRDNPPALASDKCVIGVDLARDGNDLTCICVRKGKRVVELLTYPSMEIERLSHELDSLIYRHKPEQVNIDSTGHGAWAADALKGKNIIVKSICFSENADRKDRYSNRRTELYGLASEYFSKGGTIRTNDVELQRELEASYYTFDNKFRIKLVPKDEIKKRIGKSPDRSDAFCLSLITVGDMFMSTTRSEKVENYFANNSLMDAGAW